MDGLIALALAKKYADSVGQSIISAGFTVQVEQDRSILETTGEEKVLYLLPKASSNLSNDDGYDEFVYANNKWEWVGKTDVDLDYIGLDNKPKIAGLTNLTTDVSAQLNGTVTFNQEDFRVFFSMSPGTPTENRFLVELSPNIPINYIATNDYNPESYDFNILKGIFANSGTFKIPIINLINKPSELNDLTGNVFITHYFQDCEYRDTISLIRVAMGKDINDNNLCFWQITEVTNIGSNQYNVSNSSLWQELTVGSQIVSGVVNANGTITFTDSGGNTFTTTGSSVIGPQGDDYVLTAQDKSDIADIVLSELPTTRGVLYGNTSN